jgi:hypothetical protein
MIVPAAGRLRAETPSAQQAERVRPVVSKTERANGLRVTFSAQARDFRLELAPNRRLERWAGGKWRHYTGALEGAGNSWARVSVADSALRGVIFDGHELLVLEPGEGGETWVSRFADQRFEQEFSFKGDSVAVPPGKRVPAVGSGAPRLETLTAERQLEVSAIGDAAFRARYASDADARDALLTRLNIADGIFSAQVGVALEVASINLADALSDSLDTTTDAPILLDSLGRLRQQTPALNSRGLTHLFTGRNLDGDSVGIAFSSTLCNSRYSASLAQAHGDGAVDGLITAHEIGHVFGAPHDGEGQCAATSSTQFIMAPVLQSGVSTFSQCSLEQMAPRAENASCLEPLSPPDLALPANLGNHDVGVGADFSWTIQLRNDGGRAATDARVTVQWTPALDVSSATAEGGSCIVQSALATCDLTTLAAGDAADLRFVMRSSTAGTFAAHAQVVAAGDGNGANDISNGTLNVRVGGPVPPAPQSTPERSGGGGSWNAWLLGLLAVLLGRVTRLRNFADDYSCSFARERRVARGACTASRTG